jgi:hypothetical protein
LVAIGGGRLVLVSLVYLLFRRSLAVAALRLRSREFKELEIVVLGTSWRFCAARSRVRAYRSPIGCSWRLRAGCCAERAGNRS